MDSTLRWLVPVAVAIAIACLPAPHGLAQNAWYFFAIFAGVVAGLIAEPLPSPAVGLVGITVAAALGQWVLFSPADLARPGFSPVNRSIDWALSGFANSTVWLVFTAFMFAAGYEKTGLGRRVALMLVSRMGGSTLRLGYAIMIADTLLAPLMASNTARSAGTIFPIIRCLPAFYGSEPHAPTARRVGGYLMWTAMATTCVTSSLFLTGLAPNLLAIEFIKKTANVDITWMQWFLAFAPAGIVLLLTLPALVYVLYPPEVKDGREAPLWAARELARLGPLTRAELVFAVLALLAIGFWILGGAYINPTTAGLLVVSLMLGLGVLDWDDVMGNREAWKTLTLFATLVSLADGLGRTGFTRWFAETVAHGMSSPPLSSLPVTVSLLGLTAAYFFSHYLFANITTHIVALMPVMLSVGSTIPGMPLDRLALLLGLTQGIMGILTPYGTGPAPVYYGSGYVTTAEYWRLGAIFGTIFLAALLLLSAPIVLAG
jgi:L-tartrate/succinate antiporter